MWISKPHMHRKVSSSRCVRTAQASSPFRKKAYIHLSHKIGIELIYSALQYIHFAHTTYIKSRNFSAVLLFHTSPSNMMGRFQRCTSNIWLIFLLILFFFLLCDCKPFHKFCWTFQTRSTVRKFTTNLKINIWKSYFSFNKVNYRVRCLFFSFCLHRRQLQLNWENELEDRIGKKWQSTDTSHMY